MEYRAFDTLRVAPQSFDTQRPDSNIVGATRVVDLAFALRQTRD